MHHQLMNTCKYIYIYFSSTDVFNVMDVGKVPEAFSCGHLCFSQRRHSVPGVWGCSEVEGIDTELCLLSFEVQDGENMEKPPSAVLTDVVPRLPTHNLPVFDLLTLSQFIRCLSHF